MDQGAAKVTGTEYSRTLDAWLQLMYAKREECEKILADGKSLAVGRTRFQDRVNYQSVARNAQQQRQVGSGCARLRQPIFLFERPDRAEASLSRPSISKPKKLQTGP